MREEARDAGAERIRRLRHDQIVRVRRREETLPCVANRDVDLGVRHHVAVDRLARTRDVQNEWFELHDLDALHRRNRAKPAGGRTRAQADDERPLRLARENGADHPGHHHVARVAARAAVRLAVHEKRVPRWLNRKRHAALDAVAGPHDRPLRAVAPRPQLIA